MGHTLYIVQHVLYMAVFLALPFMIIRHQFFFTHRVNTSKCPVYLLCFTLVRLKERTRNYLKVTLYDKGDYLYRKMLVKKLLLTNLRLPTEFITSVISVT